MTALSPTIWLNQRSQTIITRSPQNEHRHRPPRVTVHLYTWCDRSLDITYLLLTPAHCKCKPSLDATTFPNSRHVSLTLHSLPAASRDNDTQLQVCTAYLLYISLAAARQTVTVMCLLHTPRHSNCLSYVTRPHVVAFRRELPWYTAVVPLNCDDKTSNLSCILALHRKCFTGGWLKYTCLCYPIPGHRTFIE